MAVQNVCKKKKSLSCIGHWVCIYMSCAPCPVHNSSAQIVLYHYHWKLHIKSNLRIRNKEFSLLVICPEGLFSLQFEYFSPPTVQRTVQKAGQSVSVGEIQGPIISCAEWAELRDARSLSRRKEDRCLSLHRASLIITSSSPASASHRPGQTVI